MKYRAKEQCFVDGSIYEAGQEFNYSGEDLDFLEAVEGKPALQKPPKGSKEAKPKDEAPASGRDAI